MTSEKWLLLDIENAEEHLTNRLRYRRSLITWVAMWLFGVVGLPILGVLIEDISGMLKIAGALLIAGLGCLAVFMTSKGMPNIPKARKRVADAREAHLTWLVER